MYNISFQFRSQVEFISQYYDSYVILSSKYGIIKPTDIIEPYETTLAKGSRLKEQKSLTKQELKQWSTKVINQINEYKNQYDEIDLHISNAYLKPIKSILDNKTKHIKQPVNPGLVKLRYEELANDFKQGNIIDLEKIGEKRQSKNPEIQRWWFHKEHEPFFGYARDLKKQYPIVDEGNACMVSRGINPHTQGWVIDKSDLKYLNKTAKGSWRYKKINQDNKFFSF